MCFLNNFKIKPILFFATSAVFLCLIANIVFNHIQMTEIKRAADEQISQTLPHTYQLFELKTNVIKMQQWLTDISATRGKRGYAEGFSEAEICYKKSNLIFDKLIEEHTLLGETKIANELIKNKVLLTKLYLFGKKMAQTFIEKGEDKGNEMILKIDPIAIELQTYLDNATEEHKKENKALVLLTAKNISDFSNESFLLFLMSFFITGIAFFLIYKLLSQVKNIALSLHKLSLLDFSENPKIDGKNEIAEIYRTLSTVTIGIKEHITIQEILKTQQQESLSLLQKIAHQVPGVIFQFRLKHDGTTELPFASNGMKTVLNISPDDVKYDASSIFKKIYPADFNQLFESMLKSADSLSVWNHECRFVLNDSSNSVIWISISATPEIEANGAVLWHGFVNNVSEQKLNQESLRVAAAAFELQDGIMITDHNNNILRVNNSFSKITGFSADEIIGLKANVFKSDLHPASFYKKIWESLEKYGSWNGEIFNKRKNGDVYPAFLSITSIKDNPYSNTKYVASLNDITESKAASQEIQTLALFDHLTKLPNRRLFFNHLESAITKSKKTNHIGAVLFLDLDKFKDLNDTLGHHFGDLLLKSVASRLSSCVRTDDTVARLGGDEFVVLLENIGEDHESATKVVEAVGNKILKTLNEEHLLDTYSYHNTPSIGVTIFGIDETYDTHTILKQADIAMYDAKLSGRNALRWFKPSMQDAITHRTNMEKELLTAIKEQQFKLFFQPQIDSNYNVVGAEALLRWFHPTLGNIPPNMFIPLAEDTGNIIEIGKFILHEACSQLKKWEDSPNTNNLKLAINISFKQLDQHDFVSSSLSIINQYHINTRLLQFEITESMLINNLDETIQKIEQLKLTGITFSLDDFGTGYSSLQYLKKLPIAQLKIDQSFIRELEGNKLDQGIVKSIITLASELNLNIIAEGVETSEQREILIDNGCHYFQGYLFSKPLPIDELNSFIESFNSIKKITIKG